MTVLDIFTYAGQQVRTVMVDGEPWFVAGDVAAILELGNVRSSLALLDDDERGVHTVDTLGGAQSVATVSESGLYSLILRSRKDEAREFKRWLTREVLPSIRRTGDYVAAPAAELTRIEILTLALESEQRAQELAAKVEADAPKVAYVEEFVARDDVVLFRTAASELGIPEQKLRESLAEAGWIYRKLISERWSRSEQRAKKEYEYYASSAHADKFRSMPQHNAPRHHNGQIRTTLYIRSAALPAIKRRVTSTLALVRTG